MFGAQDNPCGAISGALGGSVQFRNFLLSALEPADLAVFGPHLTETTLSRAQPLFERGDRIDLLIFPSSACVSVVTVLRDGQAIETSTIGRESAVELLAVCSDRPASSRIFTQIGGGALTLPAVLFRERLAQSQSLLRLALLHVRATSIQAERGVACNAAHDVPGRLARWLLMTQDRVGAESFSLTQDYMAVMTGVQRTTVSQAAAMLKARGIIHYSRGNVVVRDRAGLEHAACECYGAVLAEFEALRSSAG